MIYLKQLRGLLWDGYSNQTELSNAMRLISIKSDYNMPQNCFNKVK